MKKYLFDVNTKWSMTWRAYKRAKTAKKKGQLRQELMALLVRNAMMNQFNHDNRN